MTFIRIPLSKPFSIFLTSVHAGEAAQWIRQYSEYLRPLWTRQPYQFLLPRELDDEEKNLLPLDLEEEDYGCFDRTLIAYSASYDIDTSNIRYTIDLDVEDSPCFRLLPPASPMSQRYSALELIAVLRSLRYNDAFRSISFNGVCLDAIRGIRDAYGPDKDAFISRSGSRVAIPGQDKLSILSQEIRALTLKSRNLRRLDFSYCLTRMPSIDSGGHDAGSDIPEAIFPIIRREMLTSVDSVILNGIKLGEADLDYLVDAASQKGSQLRVLEVGNCGLSVHDIDLLLSTIVAQESTLEVINISGLQGRLNPDTFQQYLAYFNRLRKLDLSSIARTSGPSPLITVDQLLCWPLEELSLSRTSVNRETARAIAAYLASDQSRNLRVLQMNQCGMTGEDVAVMLHAMTQSFHEEEEYGDFVTPRELHLHVNENRLDVACSYLSDAIARDQTPTQLSMKMVDFKKEEHFRELVEAVRKNKTLKLLDISKASLPYDAGPETCRSLQLMLEENDTLEVLDISGESAHLDVARFGIGLNLALTGLKKNKSLCVLRIEHQRLGFQGASTLASVLEENTCLREVYCEFNDINLQSFTVLVNSLQRNWTLLVLSCMDGDRMQSLGRLRRDIQMWNREPNTSYSTRSPSVPANSMKRSIYAASRLTRSVSSSASQRSGGGSTGGSTTATAVVPTTTAAGGGSGNATAIVTTTPMDLVPSNPSGGGGGGGGDEIERVMFSLSEKWDGEVNRLNWYLLRNYYLAHGIDEDEMYREIYQDYDQQPPSQPQAQAQAQVQPQPQPQSQTNDSSYILPTIEALVSEAEPRPTIPPSSPSAESVPTTMEKDSSSKVGLAISTKDESPLIMKSPVREYDGRRKENIMKENNGNGTEKQKQLFGDVDFGIFHAHEHDGIKPTYHSISSLDLRNNRPSPPNRDKSFSSDMDIGTATGTENNGGGGEGRILRSSSSNGGKLLFGGGRTPSLRSVATTGTQGTTVTAGTQGTSTSTNTKSNNYSSALKGIISKGGFREKKRMEKLRNIKPSDFRKSTTTSSGGGSFLQRQQQQHQHQQGANANANPKAPTPQLDWSPPKLDLEFG